MKLKNLIVVFGIVAVSVGVFLLVANRGAGPEEHDEHAGYSETAYEIDHGDHEGHDEHAEGSATPCDDEHAEGSVVPCGDEHAEGSVAPCGDDHSAESTVPCDDDHEGDGVAIELSVEEIRVIGLETAIAGSGAVDVKVSLPGEITFNANKLAHAVPTVPGIVRHVAKNMGDEVVAGEVIAWIESTLVGGAKMDYLAKFAEVSCCSIDTTRAQDVYDNTLNLLGALKELPSLESLQKMDDSAMGMNRSKLVSAYAEFVFARATYLREKDLFEKEISSKEEFLKSEMAFKKADAEYAATKDSVEFEIKRDLLEAKRTQQTRELELQAAERLLYLHGLTSGDLKELAKLTKNPNSQGSEEECDDPSCAECVAKAEAKEALVLAKTESLHVIELETLVKEEETDGGGCGCPECVAKAALEASQAEAAEAAAKEKDGIATKLPAMNTNETLAWYPIRSPFAGTIIEKHLVLGEVVGTESAVYVLADLSSVWVDLQVYPKDLQYVKKGQLVVISAGSEIPATRGVISYVGPVVGAGSRTALARVVLDNKAGTLRPGLFVTAKVTVSNTRSKVVVPKNAIQTLEGKKCVFTKDAHGFEPSFVEIGLENSDSVEILSGLTAGQEYVTKGAFALKSKIVTSTLDSHAGHGH
jgi:multidrug efflux pump subunit AcrA (membrane-fusion protein)